MIEATFTALQSFGTLGLLIIGASLGAYALAELTERLAHRLKTGPDN